MASRRSPRMFFRCLADGAFVLILVTLRSLGVSPAAAQHGSGEPETGPKPTSHLLQQKDLQYRGAFRLPGGQIGESTLEFGGTALAFNPQRKSLFVVGHDWHQAVAEISIPAIRTGPIQKLATAEILQPFVRICKRIPNYTLEGTVKVGGLMVVEDQLIGTLYEYYDGDANAVDSHFKLASHDLAKAEVSGLFQVGRLGGGFVGGYMTPVPAGWRTRLGASYLTGQAALSIIGRTSAGPCAIGFEPAEVGPEPSQIVPYLYYPLKNPLAKEDTQNRFFNTTTEIRGVVFPDRSSSVLFFGSHGTGPWSYGSGEECGDADRPSKGPHAPPYVYQVWAYDANSLVAVKNGQKQPWQIRPYSVWTFDLPYLEGSKHIGGAAYDPATGRIYLSQQLAEQTRPLIHVYEVGLPTVQVVDSARPDSSIVPSADSSPVYSYANPAPLPPSKPASTVSVSSVSQLISALKALRSGKTISLAAGTYDLSRVTDGLYVPEGISHWTIRGATGNRDDVVIKGAGMTGSVRYGFWIGDASGGTIADLTIDGVRDHGIIANPGAHNLLVHNVRIVDSGDQFIKSNPDPKGAGNRNGIVQFSAFEYRTTDNNNYTNGVDVHGGDGWVVRHNLFQNFLSPAGQGLAGPAVLMWNGTTNSIVDGNTFVNVARGISLGLVDKAGGFDHEWGAILNNTFYRDADLTNAVDVPILVADSPNTKVYHNTIIIRGSYPNAIEYRYRSSTNLEIKNNLCDGAIQARDGAAAVLGGNLTKAELKLFVNPAAGDLHLVSGAGPINQGVEVKGLSTDIDGQPRDGPFDVGADEYLGGNSQPATAIGGGQEGRTENRRER